MTIKMKEQQTVHRLNPHSSFSTLAPCTARLAGSNRQKDVLVEYDQSGPRAAQLVANLNRNELIKHENRGRRVLIVFEKGDPELPIIIALMEDPLDSLLSLEVKGDTDEAPKDALIDGKVINIEAEKEIILKCGKGSITIRKDGKIIIKGTNVLSRSSGPQRIKGASVNIN